MGMMMMMMMMFNEVVVSLQFSFGGIYEIYVTKNRNSYDNVSENWFQLISKIFSKNLNYRGMGIVMMLMLMMMINNKLVVSLQFSFGGIYEIYVTKNRNSYDNVSENFEIGFSQFRNFQQKLKLQCKDGAPQEYQVVGSPPFSFQTVVNIEYNHHGYCLCKNICRQSSCLQKNGYFHEKNVEEIQCP
eukprot:TRINITY_DN5203_c0_g1_i6.p2 TRINITY_DN5203_c0_g1~~TRINITY_DN5203_c0_g1_i6.p2  ORF type:complete len:187 (-),score=14.04 TRINITY_DN5203_c0_g1_i6:2-562(-)